MMIRLPAASFLPNPGELIDSLPPGAHAPSHGALLRPSSSRRPRAAEAGPALARRRPASRASASATMVRRDREQDDVVHDVGVAGLHEGAGEVRRPSPGAGRAGSSGSRRCRCRWARTGCTPRASTASSASRPDAAAAAWSPRSRGAAIVVLRRRSRRWRRRAGPRGRCWPRRSGVAVVTVPTGTRSASLASPQEPHAASAERPGTATPRPRPRRVIQEAMSSPFRRAGAGGCGRQSDPRPAPVLNTSR